MSNIYKKGENRKQQMFFPPSIDEYVSKDNPVRAIEDYVELLDMVTLDFTKAALVSTDGQPAYHPKLLLKIYIYGYLNKIRSSRKLESEIKWNIEMLWLCAGLQPSYKTIADFRKENSKALKQVFREFTLLCKELDLITGELVAVDGAFLRANASKNQLILKKNVNIDLKVIDEKIDNYLKTMAFSDKEDKKEKNLTVPRNDLSKMKKRKAKLDQDLALLEKMGVTQYNRTDPDAKLMQKPAHNLMAYNAQIVVDNTFKFIVATEISSKNNDHGKLHKLAMETKEITQKDTFSILADTGYYSAKELAKCKSDGINATVAIPNTQGRAKSKGYFIQDDFKYDEEKDCFICPNYQKLTKTTSINIKKDGTKYYFYRAGSKTCNICPLRDQCIPIKTSYKRVSVSEYFTIVKEHKLKMKTKEAKKLMKKRGALVEHPFGTIKQTLGWSHYLVRGTEKVSGENALIMFTYNFRRLLNLIGIGLFRKLILAIKDGDLEAMKGEIVAYIAMTLYLWLYFINIFILHCFRSEKLLIRL